jgi:hypothetical protein
LDFKLNHYQLPDGFLKLPDAFPKLPEAFPKLRNAFRKLPDGFRSYAKSLRELPKRLQEESGPVQMARKGARGAVERKAKVGERVRRESGRRGQGLVKVASVGAPPCGCPGGRAATGGRPYALNPESRDLTRP